MNQDTSSGTDPRFPSDPIPVDLVADLDAEFWDLRRPGSESPDHPLVDDFV